MTPLLSWMLLLSVGALGAVFAVMFARWLDGAEDRSWLRDMEQWKEMCRALELDDYEDDRPFDVGEEQPHRGD